ncbi:MAG TPA: ribosome small subunit-dependent GTPase A [Rhodothermales bacterium]|nr:ribosome small subunit-dependent GTPase A [Rhodothermales bacterium]
MDLQAGTVVRSTGSWHDVQTDERVVPSRVPGKSRLEDQRSTNPVTVGDLVDIRLLDDGTGQITAIRPRRNQLSRRAAGRRSGLKHVIAANVDHVWVVQSVELPRPNPGFIDRLLVMSAAGGIPAGIIMNKIDRAEDGDSHAVVAEIASVYQELDYPVVVTSATTGAGLDSLRNRLQGKRSVMCGPSGVGKSTLLNRLEPELDLRTGAVSEKTRKGKHTTAVAEMHEIGPHTYVVDTPGVREIGLWDLPAAELGSLMPEIRDLADVCHFPNCTHDHEPGCAVRDAVEAGGISEVRYVSYLNMLESLRAGRFDVGR